MFEFDWFHETDFLIICNLLIYIKGVASLLSSNGSSSSHSVPIQCSSSFEESKAALKAENCHLKQETLDLQESMEQVIANLERSKSGLEEEASLLRKELQEMAREAKVQEASRQRLEEATSQMKAKLCEQQDQMK